MMMTCRTLVSIVVLGFVQTQSVSTARSIADNPRLSTVESVRCLATLTDALVAIHHLQKRSADLAQDDFVGRMTVLRLLSGESAVRQLSLRPCGDSKNDNVRESTRTAAAVFERYQKVFDGNVALYEQLVRVFTIPHTLTDAESKALAENRISASQLAARFAQLSDLLKDAATVAFAATITEAPGDPEHIALNMTSSERDSFRSDLGNAFGDIANQNIVAGVEQAALVLVVQFGQDWRLAK